MTGQPHVPAPPRGVADVPMTDPCRRTLAPGESHPGNYDVLISILRAGQGGARR